MKEINFYFPLSIDYDGEFEAEYYQEEILKEFERIN